jgi:DNA-binding transcriptional LysR family regulator
MNLPLATVSRRISDLEAHLGTKLLVRTSRRLEFTDAGRSYVAACRDILAAIEQAERTAAGEFTAPRGHLLVTAPIVFGRLHVLPVIGAFLGTYPDISARLVLTDRVADFVEDRVDVAVRIGALPDSSLVATRLGSVRRVLCASPAYLDAQAQPPSQPADLAQHDCITFEGLASATSWKLGAGKLSQAVPVRSRLVVNTAEAAIDAAVSGLGITQVLSYQVETQLREGALRLLMTALEPEALPVSLVHSGHGLLPIKVRAFLDFAAVRLRGVLGGTDGKGGILETVPELAHMQGRKASPSH